MSNASHSNASEAVLDQGLLRIGLISGMSTFPSFVFLYINGTLLYVLRSRAAFRDTCRYVLLYNLLLAETVQLVQSQAMFLLSVCRVKLACSVCMLLSVLTNLTTGISPLMLVLMPLERYVAVCYPLRHASVVTVRTTAVAVAATWAVSSLNNLTRSLLLLRFPSEQLPSLQMEDLCSKFALVLGALTDGYDRAYTCVLFVSAGVAVSVAYVGVVVAARSASTDKALARKARTTLLLHLAQLGLSLSSTVYMPLILALSRVLTRMAFQWVQNVFYVCFIIFPRCLSSLIYGLRDQSIRSVLMLHLSCRLRGKLSG